MYKSIYVPVDNSDLSNRAVACAIGLGKAYSAKLVGCHVYAAKLHDYRFRQMEYTLPEEYIDEVELERQRKIHDSLITMGLKLISDSYLEGMSRLCKESSLEFDLVDVLLGQGVFHLPEAIVVQLGRVDMAAGQFRVERLAQREGAGDGAVGVV